MPHTRIDIMWQSRTIPSYRVSDAVQSPTADSPQTRSLYEDCDVRRRTILQLLQKRGSIAVSDLTKRFGVSRMTIHRDLDVLVQQGLAQKRHGWVELAATPAPATAGGARCMMCHTEVPERTQFTLQLENGERLQACCPHCGLMMLSHKAGVQSALARDFLYGRMVNALDAFYVVESRIATCCAPSVLCLQAVDAADFQRGFGGTVLNCTETIAFLKQRHHPVLAAH